MKLLVLVDDRALTEKGIIAEHGLSMYIEYRGRNILFDAGASKTALKNARTIGIDLSKIDTAICSHSHYDHGGGLPSLISRGYVKHLITGKGFFHRKYSKEGEELTSIEVGFDASVLCEYGVDHEVCDDVTELYEGCYVIGNFERTTDFEPIPERFVHKVDGEYVADDFGDEVCMAFDVPEGLVVVVGCSHPGIINMLRSIEKRLKKPVVGLIGGLHLKEAGEERCAKTADELRKMNIKYLALSHCTEDALKEYFENDAKVRYAYLKAGQVFRLADK